MDGQLVTEKESQVAGVMLGELEHRRLRVVLIPSIYPEIARTGGKVRAVIERNPSWYREFCEQHPSCRTKPRQKRHFDTSVKRAHVIRALTEIRDRWIVSGYGRRLLPIVREQVRWVLKMEMDYDGQN